MGKDWTLRVSSHWGPGYFMGAELGAVPVAALGHTKKKSMVLNYISITLGYQTRYASSMIQTLYNVVQRSPPGRDQKLTQFPPNHQKFQDFALSSTSESGGG